MVGGEGIKERADFLAMAVKFGFTLHDQTAAERFFAAEMIREQLFLQYKQEIPYSCEVVIDSFKEEETILRIRAIIYTERPTQKSIIIGKGGIALKAVGIEARKGLEEFFGKQVFLETFVKVDADWRNKDSRLKNFGYQS